MKQVSEILKNIYDINWVGLNILECGAHRSGEETSQFEKDNNCWYMEPSPRDFENLKLLRKNCLNLALSDFDGEIKFTISSHSGNSSCEYSEDHIKELRSLKSTFEDILVKSIKYESLLEMLDLKFDLGY